MNNFSSSKPKEVPKHTHPVFLGGSDGNKQLTEMINSVQLKRQTERLFLHLVRFEFVNMAAVQLHGSKLSLGQIQEDQN